MNRIKFFIEEKLNISDKLFRKYMIRVLIVIALLIVGLIRLLVGSYKTPINACIELIEDKEVNDMPYNKYGAIKSYYKFLDRNDKAVDADGQEYQDYVDYFNEEFGEDYKITYSVKEKEKLDRDTTKKIEESLKGVYNKAIEDKDKEVEGYEKEWNEEEITQKEQKKLSKLYNKYIKECSKIKVSKVYTMNLEGRIKGSAGIADFMLEDVMVARVNGRWVFLECDGEQYYLSTTITPSMIFLGMEY